MIVPEFHELEYRTEAGTAWIVLDRPHALNAFTSTLYREVRDAVRVAEADPAVDTIVITGRGRAFATGGDLREGLVVTAPDADPLAVYRFADNLPFDAVRHCPKVVIAAVNGICVGGGLIIAMSADIVVAAESARFGLPEGKVGMAEPWAPELLFGRISTALLKYLALTGKLLSASEAHAAGMILRVVPDDQLHADVRRIIDEVRATRPRARAKYKEYINRLIPETPMREASAVMRSPEARAALEAFVGGDSAEDDPVVELRG
jgi:enoyl-CoA hydratase/carnithine racemase